MVACSLTLLKAGLPLLLSMVIVLMIGYLKTLNVGPPVTYIAAPFTIVHLSFLRRRRCQHITKIPYSLCKMSRFRNDPHPNFSLQQLF